jgi:demethylmenaquinone methyltransferase/2-methoxy-6-polyprenyl-1,4-benzoquinol methylase
MASHETEQRDALRAAAGGAEKRSYVRRIFSDIAPRYDLLNHLLSFNIDKGWRTTAIAMLGWERDPAGTFVDLCTGTMDIALELAREPAFRGAVIGADFAEPMLRVGQRKATALPAQPVVADALQLPLADGVAAGVIVAFGARNFADLDAGLREAYRVLAPNGRLVILEFTTPRVSLVRVLYHLYSHHVLPIIGGLVSGHRTAYRYLPASVDNFPSADGLAHRVRAAGFANVAWQTRTMGIVAIHVGERTAAAGGRGRGRRDSSPAMSA